MEVKNLEFFKNVFAKLIDKTKQEIALEESEWDKGDSADLASQDVEKSLLLKLMGRKALYVKKLQKSFDKIDNGSFGECEECGDNIGLERLKARPMTTMCIHCKEEEERGEGHILYMKKSHTVGKELKVAVS